MKIELIINVLKNLQKKLHDEKRRLICRRCVTLTMKKRIHSESKSQNEETYPKAPTNIHHMNANKDQREYQKS